MCEKTCRHPFKLVVINNIIAKKLRLWNSKTNSRNFSTAVKR